MFYAFNALKINSGVVKVFWNYFSIKNEQKDGKFSDIVDWVDFFEDIEDSFFGKTAESRRISPERKKKFKNVQLKSKMSRIFKENVNFSKLFGKV